MTRHYAMSRVRAGDYILPANDAKTLWRISRYEDGPTNGLDLPRDRMFWGCWKWSYPIEDWNAVADPLSWEHWDYQEGLLATRAEAVEAALSMSGAAL
jgi:hypothetical protein